MTQKPEQQGASALRSPQPSLQINASSQEQEVHCDQCGFQAAKRIFRDSKQLIEKSCPRCDYWLVMTTTGRVVETGGIGSYASRSCSKGGEAFGRLIERTKLEKVCSGTSNEISVEAGQIQKSKRG